jgi:hypothetical protein
MYQRLMILVWAWLFSCPPAGMVSGQDSQLLGSFTVRAWASGQGMFYAGSRWRGGDCASSVDLGDGRVLWLFADSYVGVRLSGRALARSAGHALGRVADELLR